MENRILMVQILQNKRDSIQSEVQKIEEKIIRLQEQKEKLLEKVSSLGREAEKLQNPKGNTSPASSPKASEGDEFSALLGTLGYVSPRN